MDHKQMTKKAKKISKYEKGNVVNKYQFPILELPTILIYVIVAKLPLKTIVSCRGVCKLFQKLIEDPYFIETHLKEALSTSTSIIVREDYFLSRSFHPYILELDYTPKKSPCSGDHRDDHQFYNQHMFSRQSQGEPLGGVKCCFLENSSVLIGSCNGLLCLYSRLVREPIYCICNPVTGECMTLPRPPPITTDYNLDYSGFGFCPTTEQYKVIRFMRSQPTSKTVALVHTLGTESWENIGEAPDPKYQASFDCFLDGKLHLISASHNETVFSFDLETEKFKPVPMPDHFCPEYISKISWISVGVISGCLCLCYTTTDAYFEVFAMQEYGIRKSWIKKFAIDIEYYCGLGAEDLQRPIKFTNNGELMFLSKFNTLVSYCPQKGTFRDIKSLGHGWADAIAYVPSFMSLGSHVLRSGTGITYEKIKLESPMQVQNAS